ncbi:hypothetical protein [Buchananella felis]
MVHELAVLARLVGYEPGAGQAAVEDYLRDARRARVVYEAQFLTRTRAEP